MSTNDGPFNTIESTEQYLSILSDKITDVLNDARRELSASNSFKRGREAQAWQVVLYTTTKLSSHIENSRRLMKDLGALRDFLDGSDPAIDAPGIR